MRYLGLILALAFSGGLLVSSQALTAGQSQPTNLQMVAALTGEELKQWNQAQEELQTRDQTQMQPLNRAQVREMQALLNRRGYIISSQESDNIGRETTAAIQSFQRDQRIAVTGIPNQETLRALVLKTPQYEFFGLAPEFGEDEE